MSPVEIFGIARALAICSAWVPLPAPGGPSMMRFRAILVVGHWSWVFGHESAGHGSAVVIDDERPMTNDQRPTTNDHRLSPPASNARLLHEAIVVPHDQLRFDLLHRVHSHAPDDQELGAAE